MIDTRMFLLLLPVLAMGVAGFFDSAHGIPNPVAVYAGDLGYEYEIRGGCAGYVIFPDSTECPAWDFFTGTCGQEWTIGGRQGGRVESRPGGSYASMQAVSIFPDGSERTEVELWFELRESQGKDRFGARRCVPARTEPVRREDAK